MKKQSSIYLALLVAFCLTSCKKLNIIKAPGAVDQEVFTTTFPFELRHGVIVIEVNLKGNIYEFILDTGGFNLIDKKIANELGMKSKTAIYIPDSQGKEKKVPLLKLDKMEIAGINFLETGTGIVEFDDLNAVGCLDLKGMIGANLMQNAIWEIDYEQQQITISHNMDAFDIPSNSHVIPFTTGTLKSPKIQVMVEGQVEKEIEIDLGSTNGFSLSTATLEKTTIQAAKGTGLFSAGLYGYGKPETLQFATVNQLSIGNLKLNNQLVTFKPTGDSTIGNDFLKDYRVIFNWFDQELILIPVSTPEIPILETYGIKPIYNQQLLVGFIYEQSSAAKVGLQITDEIIELNGQNIESVSQENWCTVLIDFQELTDQSITIKVKRAGEILSFELTRSKLL